MLTTKKILSQLDGITLNTSVKTDWITDGKILYQKNDDDKTLTTSVPCENRILKIEKRIDSLKDRPSTINDCWSYANIDGKTVIGPWDWDTQYIEFLANRFPEASIQIVHDWRTEPPTMLVYIDGKIVAALVAASRLVTDFPPFE